MLTEIFVALIGLAGLVIPLSTLLEYDAEASADENCDVYRVIATD